MVSEKTVNQDQVISLDAQRFNTQDGVVWQDPSMERLLKIATRVAKTPSTILVNGESGVGKEVVARFIHRNSERANAPFIAINCATLPQGVLESELFGHEKGAFSGAIARHQGVFERAHGGTLFLDEVSEISLETQAKLLRVIQERTLVRVGGHQEVHVDIRIIAATNKNLLVCVEQNTFRQDLFYRLNVFPVLIPPLRQRPLDVEPLVLHYLAQFAERFDVEIEGITARALRRLRDYTFPGNVRELVNILERATILAYNTTIIDLEHLVFDTDGVLVGSTPSGEAKIIDPDELVSFLPGDEPLTEIRRKVIMATLDRFDGNRTRTAEALGVSLRTVRNKLRDYRERGLWDSGLFEDTET